MHFQKKYFKYIYYKYFILVLMYQKIIKSISENFLIPASSYALFELGKNYKSIKNYMINNITLNKSPFK
jgi:hypothetical protein